MSSLFHLRLDVRKVQDYIFMVPKLKYMLGANSKIGELFSTTLPDLMKNSKSIFCSENLNCIQSKEVKSRFDQNILSSSGGHFEAVFEGKEELYKFISMLTVRINQDIPDLEYSISWREFGKDDSLAEFSKRKINSVSSTKAHSTWFDLPYYELCELDGLSCASKKVNDPDGKEVKIGNKANIMNDQADLFYQLLTKDAIAAFYKELGIQGSKLAKKLDELAKCGTSLKDNMLAYIKIDGNGTGARFKEMRDGIDSLNVLDGFIKIEEFWAQNRSKIWDSLKATLSDNKVTEYTGSHLPYLLLMLGGDDLFLVCIPEIALYIASTLAATMGTEFPISAGIAFVKESYPVGLANHLAESCLESAKAGSYRHPGKPAYIDWHVQFDSIYQEIPDIRKNAYMLQYSDNNKEVTEILCLRPYSLEDTKIILEAVENMAKMLDDPKREAANNKVKGYRSVLKNGKSEVDYFTQMLLAGEQYKDLREFMGDYTKVNGKKNKEILLNSALDKIELLEIYRKKKDKEGAPCKA